MMRRFCDSQSSAVLLKAGGKKRQPPQSLAACAVRTCLTRALPKGTPERVSSRSLQDEDMTGHGPGVDWLIGGKQVKVFWDDETSPHKIEGHPSFLGALGMKTLPCDDPNSEGFERAKEADKKIQSVEERKQAQKDQKTAQYFSSFAWSEGNAPAGATYDTSNKTLHSDFPKGYKEAARKMQSLVEGVDAQMNVSGNLTKKVSTAPSPPQPQPQEVSRPKKISLTNPAAKKISLTDPTAKKKTAASSAPEINLEDVTKEARAQKQVDKDQAKKDADEFYSSIPNTVTKDDMWDMVNKSAEQQSGVAGVAAANQAGAGDGKKKQQLSDQEMQQQMAARLNPNMKIDKEPHYVDHIRNEEDIKDQSWFHYTIGQQAFDNPIVKEDFYAMHILGMALNKSRWVHMDVGAQKGVSTQAVGMRGIFWKESCHKIIQSGAMIEGQFVDSHPVLRPFASCVKRHKPTKTFMRGFVDSRLKIYPQPGNMEQLIQHFDRTHGYFYNTLLEVLGRRDDNLDHLMKHIGRAVGLTQAIMLWRKYATFGHTLFPADMCVKNHVSLGLLRNVVLANRDDCVKKLIFEVAQVAFEEMHHASLVAKDCDPVAWPVIAECMFANYYLQFLQNYKYDVSKFWTDTDLQGTGFQWYVQKKLYNWERHHDVGELVDSAAPVPYLGVSWGYNGIKFTNQQAVKNNEKAWKTIEEKITQQEADKKKKSSCGHDH